MGFPYISTGDNFTVFVNNTQVTFNILNVDRSEVVDLLGNGDPATDGERLIGMVTPKIAVMKMIEDFENEAEVQGICTRVELVNDKILFDGIEVHNALTDRIYDIISQGLDPQKWLMFAENIYNNPLDTARSELALWLEACKMPITDDGCFLAYKKVRSDYKDIHSGTMDNSVGNTVEMDRSLVSTDRYQTCAAGLHFCSESYLKYFGSFGGSSEKILLLKINPADVVAIPNDYGNAKGRTWRYQVIGEIETQAIAERAVYPAVVDSADVDYDYDDYEEDYDAGYDEDALDEAVEWLNGRAKKALDELEANSNSGNDFLAKIWKRIIGSK